MKNDTRDIHNPGEHPRFSENDPRLTAYALGEMDASERAAFESETGLAANPAAQTAIAEIRAMAAQLETALAAEPAPENAADTGEPAREEDWRAAREAEARERRRNDPYSKKRPGFPYFLVSGLAGALFTVLFFTVLRPEWRDGRRLAEYERKNVSGTTVINGRAYALLPLGESTQAVVGAPATVTQASVDAFARPADTSAWPGGFSANGPARVAVSPHGADTESRAAIRENKFQRVIENPLSTFSINVDSASYTNIRRLITQGRLPPPDAVRIEEMLNYFTYRYEPPAKKGAAPFAATMEVAAAPWNPAHRLVRIGIKGRELDDEARRLLAEQTLGTLVTIAKDVKLQVEFNPAQAEAYRLVGYEKRMLARGDFNNNRVDAGEIGAGHAVTALYEVIPANTRRRDGAPAVDALKYQMTPPARMELDDELLTLKIHWKAPLSDASDKVEFTLEDKGAAFDAASADFKFATAVAGFGMLLRDSPEKGLATYGNVLAWAKAGASVAGANDTDGRRAEFLDLVRRARQMSRN